MQEAQHYINLGNNLVRCELCPHICTLQPNETGLCHARKNIDGRLFSLNYGKLSALNSDPIEKKPLYHFYPGNSIISVGSYGCNMACTFCQNWQIAHPPNQHFAGETSVESEKIVKQAQTSNNSVGIAFTYNEPVIYFEWMLKTAKLAKETGLQTVMVSNGYINPVPLQELLPYIDAFNIDLKFFNKSTYKEYSNARLSPVQQILKLIKKAGKHLEITNLVVSDVNDSASEIEEMTQWIATELGTDTIMHFSRYFPNYQLKNRATDTFFIEQVIENARRNLNYVYAGNMSADSNTYCPQCGQLLVERRYYKTRIIGLEHGKCAQCKSEIPIIYDYD